MARAGKLALAVGCLQWLLLSCGVRAQPGAPPAIAWCVRDPRPRAPGRRPETVKAIPSHTRFTAPCARRTRSTAQAFACMAACPPPPHTHAGLHHAHPLAEQMPRPESVHRLSAASGVAWHAARSTNNGPPDPTKDNGRACIHAPLSPHHPPVVARPCTPSFLCPFSRVATGARPGRAASLESYEVFVLKLAKHCCEHRFLKKLDCECVQASVGGVLDVTLTLREMFYNGYCPLSSARLSSCSALPPRRTPSAATPSPASQ